MVEIIAGWKAGDDGAAQRRWAQDLLQSLAPFALPGGYPNFLAPDDREQVAEAYGGNAARLRENLMAQAIESCAPVLAKVRHRLATLTSRAI
jgi:hypothetical protein